MIVDTSAIMAILLEEPGWEAVRQSLHSARRARMAAPTLVELHIVARGRDTEFTSGVDAMLERYGVEIVPFSRAHAELARLAYLTYGKGFNSRARLNLGDCFSYALAKATGEPLLFVGNDFTQTDLIPALGSSATSDTP